HRASSKIRRPSISPASPLPIARDTSEDARKASRLGRKTSRGTGTSRGNASSRPRTRDTSHASAVMRNTRRDIAPASVLATTKDSGHGRPQNRAPNKATEEHRTTQNKPNTLLWPRVLLRPFAVV